MIGIAAASAAPLLVFAALAARYVWLAPLETDEGFYGMAARNAAAGEVPYRDFAFNQTHLFPYLHGLLVRPFAPGLFAHRALCAGYAALVLVVLAVRAIEPRRAFSHGVAAWALALSPFFIARSVLAQSFSMAALLLAGAGAALLWMAPGRRRTWIVAVAGAGAIGCKLTVAPAALVLWGYELLASRGPRAVVAPAVAVALLFGPVIAADPQAWWFWTLEYHLGMRAVEFRTAAAYRDHLAIAPGVLALGVWAAASLARTGALRTPPAAVLLAALGGWAVQLPLRSTQGEYATLFVPLAALGVAEVLRERAAGWSARAKLLAAAVPALGLVFGTPAVDPGLRRALDEVSAVLRTRLSSGQVLLTPVPVVAVHSGVALLDGLAMGPFSITAELPEARARALHLQTPQSLIAAVRTGRVGAVVLTGEPSTWDFYWSVPSLEPVPAEQRAALFAALAEAGFHPALRNREFTVLLPGAPPAPPFWAPAAEAPH